jgi:hypothetical protein
MVARIYIIFTTGRRVLVVKYRHKVPTRGKNNINSGYHELFLKYTPSFYIEVYTHTTSTRLPVVKII